MSDAAPLAEWTTEQLVKRKQDLEYMAQMVVLSGMAMNQTDEAEYLAVRAELERRQDA